MGENALDLVKQESVFQSAKGSGATSAFHHSTTTIHNIQPKQAINAVQNNNPILSRKLTAFNPNTSHLYNT
jgi:hypothetical protein